MQLDSTIQNDHMRYNKVLSHQLPNKTRNRFSLSSLTNSTLNTQPIRSSYTSELKVYLFTHYVKLTLEIYLQMYSERTLESSIAMLTVSQCHVPYEIVHSYDHLDAIESQLCD